MIYRSLEGVWPLFQKRKESFGVLWRRVICSHLVETRMVQPCLRVVRNTKICSEVQCDRISGSFGQRMYVAE